MNFKICHIAKARNKLAKTVRINIFYSSGIKGKTLIKRKTTGF